MTIVGTFHQNNQLSSVKLIVRLIINVFCVNVLEKELHLISLMKSKNSSTSSYSAFAEKNSRFTVLGCHCLKLVMGFRNEFINLSILKQNRIVQIMFGLIFGKTNWHGKINVLKSLRHFDDRCMKC